VNGFADIEELCRATRGTISSAIIEACLKAKTGDQLTDVFENHDFATVDLLERLLVFSPVKRLSASQTLSHPFFAE